jgi:predicted small lipoprotein YifL
MLCWARYLFIAVVIALGTLSMIGACGHQGPLFMPPPKAESAPSTGTKAGTDIPQVPAPGGQPAVNAPASDEGLLAWPAGRAGRCTLGCPEPVGSAQ